MKSNVDYLFLFQKINKLLILFSYLKTEIQTEHFNSYVVHWGKHYFPGVFLYTYVETNLSKIKPVIWLRKRDM